MRQKVFHPGHTADSHTMADDFSTRAKSFIMGLVMMQEQMHRKGYIQHNVAAITENANWLRLHLGACIYSNIQMGLFFTRHADKITSLLPGQDHTGKNAEEDLRLLKTIDGTTFLLYL